MSKWLDKLHDGADEINIIARQLDDLSISFEATGNMTMAQKLDYFVRRLQDAAIKIRSGAGEAVFGELQRSQEMSKTMLAAALGSSALALDIVGEHDKAKVVAKTGVALTTITGKKIPKKRKKKT